MGDYIVHLISQFFRLIYKSILHVTAYCKSTQNKVMDEKAVDMSGLLGAVLIIEHDPLVRSMYMRILQHEYDVLTAHTVSQCESHCQRTDLRVVVIEPHRPDGKGNELLETLRSTLTQRQIPVIICSVLDAKRTNHEAGVHSHLVKPVTPEALRQIITQF